LNEIDWYSVFTRGIVGVIFGPLVGWALWYAYSKLLNAWGQGSVGTYYSFDGFLESVLAGFILGPILLIGWGIWGESVLASLSKRLSRKRPKAR
jgi:hypothetical protein